MHRALYRLMALAFALVSSHTLANASAPAITTIALTAGVPATNGELVGTVVATNSPTSWLITSCAGCTNYFSIDNSGVVKVTSAGAAAITTTSKYALIVQATNTSGGSSATVWAKFKCPQGASYNDGCANSRIGPPQHPGLFSGYQIRPPWNVAGVDYYVGMPAGATMIAAMKDWTTLGSTPGIDILGTTVRCDGTYATTPTSGPVTLDLIDFSLHGGATLSIPAGGCSGLTVTQSKFGNVSGSIGCSNGSSGKYYLIQNQNPGASLTIQYNTFDATNCQMGTAAVVYASGNTTVQYNDFYHLQGQVLQAPSGPYSIDYRYNLIDSFDYKFAPTNHNNWQEFGGAVGDVSDLVSFNTAYQPGGLSGGGEGWQFYGNSGGTQKAATLSNNTVVVPNGTPISYWVHGHGAYSPATTLVPTAYLQDNYLDPRGMIGSSGQAYPGSVTGWTCSGNINMNTGATINEGC